MKRSKFTVSIEIKSNNKNEDPEVTTYVGKVVDNFEKEYTTPWWAILLPRKVVLLYMDRKFKKDLRNHILDRIGFK